MKVFILVLSLIASNAMAAKIYQRIGNVPADNLCDAGAVFKTLKPVTYCEKLVEVKSRYHGEADTGSDWVCKAYVTTQLEISKETKVCLKMVANEVFQGCTKWGKGIQSSTVWVEEKNPHMKDNYLYSTYKIPACAP